MYAYFEGCDPIKSKVIERSDQMLPYFMMKVVGNYPGLPGLFVAGIFSGALSSVSSFVNSLAAVTLEDYLKPNIASLRSTDDGIGKRETLIAKLLAFFFGLLCLALTYLAEQMSGILQASLTVFGIVGGPLLGLFTLGMCTRSCSPKSAFISFFASLILGFWIGFGSLSSGLQPIPLQTSLLKCTSNNSNLSEQSNTIPTFLNYSTSSPSFLPLNSIANDVKNKKRNKRRNPNQESMMVNTITVSTTNNDNRMSSSNNNDDDDGYTSSNNSYSNVNSSSQNSAHSNFNGSNMSSLVIQPVNLVQFHHTSNRIQHSSLEDENLSKSRMTVPASSSQLFDFESRIELSQSESSLIQGKKEEMRTMKSGNSNPNSGRGYVQSSHEHYSYSDGSNFNSNERSLLFDHENNLGYNTNILLSKHVEEKNLRGDGKEQQVVIMNLNDLTEKETVTKHQKPVVDMNLVIEDERIERREINAVNSIGLESIDVNPMVAENGNHGFKVTNYNDGVQNSDPNANVPGSSNPDDGQARFQWNFLKNSQFEYLKSEIENSTKHIVDPSTVFYLYKLSYMYLAGFTCLFEVILGLLLSYTIFPNRKEVRPELLTPLLNRGLFRHKPDNNYFTEINNFQSDGKIAVNETRF